MRHAISAPGPAPATPDSRRARRAVTVLAAATLLAAAIGGCADRASFRGIALDPPRPAPALRLADARGDTFDLAAQRGRAVLVFFGYTRCPDVCPTTLADWARVRQALGRDAERVRFVFVSVDTTHDTRALAQEYAHRFDPAFVGLVADADVMARLTADFQMAVYEAPGAHEGHVNVVHGSQVFMVDPAGRLRVLHTAGSTADDFRADVERLLD